MEVDSRTVDVVEAAHRKAVESVVENLCLHAL